MAARALRGPWGLRFLTARFSQRAATGSEFRSAYSLDKLYPPRDGGTASDPASGNGVVSGGFGLRSWGGAEPLRGLPAAGRARPEVPARLPRRLSRCLTLPPLPSCFPGGGQAGGLQHSHG